MILGLICLVNTTAAKALFSLGPSGNAVAWAIPIFSRIVWGKHKFKPGSFYTGELYSRPIAIVALLYLIFEISLCMFPLRGPSPTRKLAITFINFFLSFSLPSPPFFVFMLEASESDARIQ